MGLGPLSSAFSSPSGDLSLSLSFSHSLSFSLFLSFSFSLSFFELTFRQKMAKSGAWEDLRVHSEEMKKVFLVDLLSLRVSNCQLKFLSFT